VSYDITVECEESLPDVDLAVLDLEAIEALVARVLEAEQVADGTGVTLLFAGDEFVHGLNLEHRGVDEPTDVLAFGAEEGDVFPSAPDEPRYLGDVAVAVPTARRQAAAAALGAGEEIAHLVVHGLLHMLGYDHEEPADDAAMRAREESYLGPCIHAARPDEGHAAHG
jgi:probable rRNA maturation factor